jgi:hypothetical protein
MREAKSSLQRLLKAFAAFWWDFFVGETPELFVSVVVIIGVVAIISNGAHNNAVAVVLLPALVIFALTISLARARKGRRGK